MTMLGLDAIEGAAARSRLRASAPLSVGRHPIGRVVGLTEHVRTGLRSVEGG